MFFEQCYFNMDHHFKPVIGKQQSTQGKKKRMQQTYLPDFYGSHHITQIKIKSQIGYIDSCYALAQG